MADVVASAEDYRSKLGFSFDRFWGGPPCFCMPRRDSHVVTLSQGDDKKHIVPHYKAVRKMWNIYFWVDDVGRIYDELKRRGAKIGCDLCIQPYGCKKFGIQGLDGYDIAFGQDLEKQPN